VLSKNNSYSHEAERSQDRAYCGSTALE